MREIKFRAWLFNKMIKPMSIQKMVHQRKSNIPLRILEKECVFMQYTDKKDKNDVEIYESDIIEYMTGQLKNIPVRHIVAWNKNESRFSFGCKADEQYMFYNVEVIGNIYENKELLND